MSFHFHYRGSSHITAPMASYFSPWRWSSPALSVPHRGSKRWNRHQCGEGLGRCSSSSASRGGEWTDGQAFYPYEKQGSYSYPVFTGLESHDSMITIITRINCLPWFYVKVSFLVWSMNKICVNFVVCFCYVRFFFVFFSNSLNQTEHGWSIMTPVISRRSVITERFGIKVENNTEGNSLMSWHWLKQDEIKPRLITKDNLLTDLFIT